MTRFNQYHCMAASSFKRNKSSTKNGACIGPPIVWAIAKEEYSVDEFADGKPIFQHEGHRYVGSVKGSGAIKWYILCIDHSAVSRCYTQGVQHTDGRLLMLRLHNHPAVPKASPLKRCRISVVSPAEKQDFGHIPLKQSTKMKQNRWKDRFHPRSPLAATITNRWKHINVFTSPLMLGSSTGSDKTNPPLAKLISDRWKDISANSLNTKCGSDDEVNLVDAKEKFRSRINNRLSVARKRSIIVEQCSKIVSKN